jgi:hypothetical protein
LASATGGASGLCNGVDDMGCCLSVWLSRRDSLTKLVGFFRVGSMRIPRQHSHSRDE